VHGGDWKIVAVGSGLNDWLGCGRLAWWAFWAMSVENGVIVW